MLESLANIGEFVGAIGVIVTVGYLAIQIRQNTKAVRTSSYHQAAEQTWSASLTMAANADLAELWTRASMGEPLSPAEQARIGAYDLSVLFGMENLMRLYEEKQLDEEVFANVIDNTLFFLMHPRILEQLDQRPGMLSKKLKRFACKRAEDIGFEVDLLGVTPGVAQRPPTSP